MPGLTILPTDILTDICAHCGIAIYNKEIAAEFSGNIIDYGIEGDKGTYHGGYALCGECWLRVRESMTTDLENAVQKRISIKESDVADRGKQDLRKDGLQPPILDKKVDSPAVKCHHDKGSDGCWWISMSKYNKCPYPSIKCTHKVGDEQR